MNKSYRSIWNESLGAWVAVSEISSARGKPNKSVVAKLVDTDSLRTEQHNFLNTSSVSAGRKIGLSSVALAIGLCVSPASFANIAIGACGSVQTNLAASLPESCAGATASSPSTGGGAIAIGDNANNLAVASGNDTLAIQSGALPPLARVRSRLAIIQSRPIRALLLRRQLWPLAPSRRRPPMAVRRWGPQQLPPQLMQRQSDWELLQMWPVPSLSGKARLQPVRLHRQLAVPASSAAQPSVARLSVHMLAPVRLPA